MNVYIRSKYAQYFAKESDQGNKYYSNDVVKIDEESPVKKYKSKKQVSFDQLPKYTFGKIEVDPNNAAQQYYQIPKGSQTSMKVLTSNKRITGRRSSKHNNIDERYAKYVVNRPSQKHLLTNNDISEIKKTDESLRNQSRRDYLFTEYLEGTQNEGNGGTSKIESRLKKEKRVLFKEDAQTEHRDYLNGRQR